MPSWVSVSLEREPSYFSGPKWFGQDWAVLARSDAKPLGMCGGALRQVFVNGTPREMGYLGSLRISDPYRHRLAILRDGFEAVGKLCDAGELGIWFTVVASENRPARRVLEANLAGMPTYRALNQLTTCVLSTQRARPRGLWQRAHAGQVDSLCRFYNERATQHNLAQQLSQDVAHAILDFLYVAVEGDRIVGTIALLDQRAYRQIVVRGYRQPLRMARPLWNMVARISRRPRLPAVGQQLQHITAAFMALDQLEEQHVADYLADVLQYCASELLILGLHEHHRWLPAVVQRFRPQTYLSTIYTVSLTGESSPFDTRPAQPELALL